MNKNDKIVERFMTLPKEFTFDEMEKLLTYFGYEKSNKGKTLGSRVIFKKDGSAPILLHKPHPSNIMKEYALKQVYNVLRNNELI